MNYHECRFDVLLTPSLATQDIIDTLMRENQSLRELFERLTDCEWFVWEPSYSRTHRYTAWREETERQHKELLDTVQSTANVQVPFNVQGVGVLPP